MLAYSLMQWRAANAIKKGRPMSPPVGLYIAFQLKLEFISYKLIEVTMLEIVKLVYKVPPE